MQEENKQSGGGRMTSVQGGAQAIRFDWRWKTQSSAPHSLWRRMRRNIGGWIAYSVTFYRTAAK